VSYPFASPAEYRPLLLDIRIGAGFFKTTKLEALWPIEPDELWLQVDKGPVQLNLLSGEILSFEPLDRHCELLPVEANSGAKD